MPGIVLIIDNDGGMRQIIERILVPHGYTVVHAEDGTQGLEKFQRNEPHIVLLDIRLSDIDAPDMLERLRKARPGIPVVLMSGLAEAETAAELVKKGAAANISKPFKVDTLVGLLNGIISRRPGVSQPPVPAGAAAAAPIRKDGNKAPAAIEKRALKPVKNGGGSRKKTALIAGGICTAALVAGCIAYFSIFAGGSKQFRLISDSPSAMYVGGGSVFIADWMAEAVYKYDINNFSVQDKYKVPGMQAAGLAFDGKFFWATHSLEGTIHKLTFEPRPDSLAVFTSTGPSPSGLFCDGKNLWVADSQTNKIYKYLTDDKFTLVNTFESPARSPRALFGAKNSLYIIEGATNRIYQVRTTDFMVEGVYLLPGFESAKRRLIAVYIDGKYIWACADTEAVVSRFTLKDLRNVKI
jgi:CheY-like chemotaxis protein